MIAQIYAYLFTTMTEYLTGCFHINHSWQIITRQVMVVCHLLWCIRMVFDLCHVLKVFIVVINQFSTHYISSMISHIYANIFTTVTDCLTDCFHINHRLNLQICNKMKSNRLLMFMLPFSVCMWTVWQEDIAFGSIYIYPFCYIGYLSKLINVLYFGT